MAIQARLAERSKAGVLSEQEFETKFVFPILNVALLKLQFRFKQLTELEN